MPRMLGMRVPSSTDLQGLPPQALALIEQMQRHIEQQEQALLAHRQQLPVRQGQGVEIVPLRRRPGVMQRAVGLGQHEPSHRVQ